MDLNQFQSTPATFISDIQSLNDNSIVCRRNSINQIITTVRQSIDQLQQCIPSNNSADELTKTIIQYQQLQKDLQQDNQRLQQLQADQQRLENQIAEYQVQRNPMQAQIEELVYIIEVEIQRHLPNIQQCNNSILEIRRDDLHGYVSFNNPPYALLKILQATISIYKPTTPPDIVWQQIQCDLREPRFYQQLRNLNLCEVPISRVNKAQEFISDVTNEMAARVSSVGLILYQWVHAVSNFIRGNISVQPIRQQYQELQERLQQQIEQETNAKQQLILNQEQQQVAIVNISQQQEWLTENNQLVLQSQFSEQAYKCLQQIENSQNKLLKFMECYQRLTSDNQIFVRFIDLSLRLHPIIINQQTRLYGILSTLQPLDNELIFSKEDQTKQLLQQLIDFQNDEHFKIRFVKGLPFVAAHTFNLLQQKVTDDPIRNTFFEQIYNIYSTIIQNNQFTHSIQYISEFISEVQLLLYKEFPSYYYDLGNLTLQDNLQIIDYLMSKEKQPQASSKLFQAAQFVELNQSGRVYKEYLLVRFAKEMDIQCKLKEQKKIESLNLIAQINALEHKIKSHLKRISNLPQTEENQRILITQLSNCQASIDDLEDQLVETKAKLDEITLEIQQTQTKLKNAQGLCTLGFPIKRTDISYIAAIQIPSNVTYFICMQLMVLIGKPTEWDNIKRNIVSYYQQIVKTKYENIEDEMIEIIKLMRIQCSPTIRKKDILNKIDYWLEDVIKNYEIYSQINELKQQLELEMETSQSIQLTINDLNEQLNLKKTEQASLNEINSKLLNRITKHRQLETCYQTNYNNANRVLQQIQLNRNQAEYNQQYINEFNNFSVIQKVFEYTSFDWRTTLADRFNFVHPDLIQHINQSISKSEQTEASIIQNTEISKLDINQLNLDLRRKEIKMYLITAWVEEYPKFEDQFFSLFKSLEYQSQSVKLNQQSYCQQLFDSSNKNKLIIFIVEVIIILWKYDLAHEANDVYPQTKIINRDIRLEYAIGEIEQILQTYFKKAEDNTLTSLEFMRSILMVLNQDNNVKLQIAYEMTLQLFKIYEPDIIHNITQSIPSINQAIKQYFKFEQMLD